MTVTELETQTAEVHVVKMGRGNLTLSKYRQLDRVDESGLEPFGRVHDPKDPTYNYGALFHVVGRSKATGALVRAAVYEPDDRAYPYRLPPGWAAKDAHLTEEQRLRVAQYKRDLNAYHMQKQLLPLILV